MIRRLKPAILMSATAKLLYLALFTLQMPSRRPSRRPKGLWLFCVNIWDDSDAEKAPGEHRPTFSTHEYPQNTISEEGALETFRDDFQASWQANGHPVIDPGAEIDQGKDLAKRSPPARRGAVWP